MEAWYIYLSLPLLYIMNINTHMHNNLSSLVGWWKIFRVTGHLCGEFTGHWWIPLTKASDA